MKIMDMNERALGEIVSCTHSGSLVVVSGPEPSEGPPQLRLSLAIIQSVGKMLGCGNIFLEPLPYEPLASFRGGPRRRRLEISTAFGL
jgi:hypothetical protein